MAGDITIKSYEVKEAERFLEALLTSKIPEGNFSPGSHLHDVVIKAFAYVVAYIRAEVREVSAMQSLLRLGESSGYSVDATVDNILSNWFITRRDGTKSAGVLKVSLDPSVEAIIVPASAVFTRSEGLTFVPVSDSDTVFSRELNLVPEYNEEGDVAAYSAYLAVEAEFGGVSSSLAAGSFESWTDFSPYVTAVSNEASFSSSEAKETTEELIDRAKESITSRDFLSSRSITATLLEEIPTVDSVTCVGAGDPEMMRDRIVGFGEGVSVHGLGHVNVYTKVPMLPNLAYAGVVAANESVLTLPAGTRIAAITKVTVARLGEDNFDDDPAGYPPAVPQRVSYRFNPTTGVYTYCIGDNYIALDALGRPEIDASGDIVTQELTTTNSAQVVKAAIYNVGDLADNGTFAVGVEDPVYFNTANSALSIDVGVTSYNRRVSVEYDSFTGHEVVDAFLTDSERRVLAANLLTYNHIPLRVAVHIRYVSAAGASELPLDLAQMGVSAYINRFSEDRSLRAGDIVRYVMDTFSAYVASVALPLRITSLLEAPDGRLVQLYTEDGISFDIEKVAVPDLYTAEHASLQQVSRRTSSVVCSPKDITIEEVT